MCKHKKLRFDAERDVVRCKKCGREWLFQPEPVVVPSVWLPWPPFDVTGTVKPPDFPSITWVSANDRYQPAASSSTAWNSKWHSTPTG